MQLLSTVAFLALAVQCAVAAPERNLLRSGYDKPINFSDLKGLTGAPSYTSTHQQPNGGSSTTPSSVDSTPKGKLPSGASSLPHDKKSGVSPDTKSLPAGGSGNNHDKNIVSTDLTTLAGRSGLQSGMEGKDASDKGKMSSLQTHLTKGGSGAETSKGVTDSNPKRANPVGDQLTSTHSGTKSYPLLSKNDLPDEERSLPGSKKSSKMKMNRNH
ncbi:hypothetical protein PR003_g20343 [Phytophthora rubi]|uniref:RxLR effector protein n=1 Tax=Phytophthora rubi TaxID=129364 RepID=A0A6A3K307_9STRA|nr:hypothetical protein PR002_g19368 [Phytophthora rubi]KAE8999055.1 hypothetical protein PR001_g19152 [Phytophthora rubi]KAE9310102.1 hypothetical protein PR003_g20343 [Phytophthora rubi]